MNLVLSLFALLAKLLAFFSKLLGKGRGTALPGYIVEKYTSFILSDMGKGFDKIIFISGTNGKTTTRALLVDVFESNGVEVCTNRGGANIIRGIASSLLLNLNVLGRPKAKTLILEVEEASLPKLVKYIVPETLILTNVFRDQLDAYGEVDKTVGFFKETLKIVSPEVIINADDSKLLESVSKYSGKILGFKFDIPESSKPKFEITPIKVKLNEVVLVHVINGECKLEMPDGETKTLTTLLPGVFNLYNLISAYLCVYKDFGTNTEDILANFRPVFGRGEIVHIGDTKINLFLVKNPAGFDQVLNHISTQKNRHERFKLAFIINDNIADGKDVSWLWDIDLEKYTDLQIDSIFTSGSRGMDMLLRLEYAGYNVDKSDFIFDYKNLLDLLTIEDGEVYVLSTYTALLDFRKILQTKVKLKNIDDSGN